VSVLALAKALLTAGILTESHAAKDTDTGTPQGRILSPLLANVAISVLNEHFAEAAGGPRSTTKQRGLGANAAAQLPAHSMRIT
jgi:RNA-directed DNA polymerase